MLPCIISFLILYHSSHTLREQLFFVSLKSLSSFPKLHGLIHPEIPTFKTGGEFRPVKTALSMVGGSGPGSLGLLFESNGGNSAGHQNFYFLELTEVLNDGTSVSPVQLSQTF